MIPVESFHASFFKFDRYVIIVAIVMNFACALNLLTGDLYFGRTKLAHGLLSGKYSGPVLEVCVKAFCSFLFHLLFFFPIVAYS